MWKLVLGPLLVTGEPAIMSSWGRNDGSERGVGRVGCVLAIGMFAGLRWDSTKSLGSNHSTEGHLAYLGARRSCVQGCPVSGRLPTLHICGVRLGLVFANFCGTFPCHGRAKQQTCNGRDAANHGPADEWAGATWQHKS